MAAGSCRRRETSDSRRLFDEPNDDLPVAAGVGRGRRCVSGQGSAVEYPGQDPGPASIAIHQDRIEFANQVLSGSWGCSGGGLHGTTVRDQQEGVSWKTTRDLFQVVLADGTTYSSTSLSQVGDISIRPLSPQRDAARLADRSVGKVVEVALVSADGRLRATWRAIMLDGANYVRQELELTAPQEPLAIREIAWLDENVADAVNMGSVDGSLVAIGPFFLGCEDPMAENRVAATQESGTRGGMVRCRLPRTADLPSGEKITLSFVIGVAPQGQRRRAFLVLPGATNALIRTGPSCTTTPGTTSRGSRLR